MVLSVNTAIGGLLTPLSSHNDYKWTKKNSGKHLLRIVNVTLGLNQIGAEHQVQPGTLSLVGYYIVTDVSCVVLEGGVSE